jgi:hypothetical protein
MLYPKTIILCVALSSMCIKTVKCMEPEKSGHLKRSASAAKLLRKRESRRLRIDMETGKKNAEKYGSLIEHSPEGSMRRSARIANPVVKPTVNSVKKFVVKKKAGGAILTTSHVAKSIDPEDLFTEKCRKENPKFHRKICQKNGHNFSNPTLEKYKIDKKVYDRICKIHAIRQSPSVPYDDPGLNKKSFICLGYKISERDLGMLDEFDRYYDEQNSAPVFALPKNIPFASDYSQSSDKKSYVPLWRGQ